MSTYLWPIVADLLLKSTGILLLAFAVQSLWRSASAAQRCLVWAATFAVLAMLPATLLITPRWSLALESAPAPTLSPPPAEIAPTQVVWTAPDAMTIAPVAATPQRAPWTLAQIALGVWMTGISLGAAWRLLGLWQLRRLCRQCRKLDDARVAQWISRIAHEFRIHRRTELLVTSHVTVPLTWGTFRPALLLPQQALRWDDAALAAALRHELGHIRHFDAATRAFMGLVTAVFWPHALVWLAARAWRTAQEQACDDVVLRAGAVTQEYAMQLLEAARRMHGSTLSRAPIMAMAKTSTLETRLSAIMDDNRNRHPLRAAAWWSGAFSVLAAFAFCAVMRVGAQEAKVPAAAPIELDGGRLTFVEGKGTQEAKVKLQMQVIDLPAGSLTPRPGEPPLPKSAKMTCEAVLDQDELPELLARTEKIPGVNRLSAPSITTRLGQKATVETGTNADGKGVKAGDPDFEGIRAEFEPASKLDGEKMNIGVLFQMRKAKGKDSSGKIEYGAAHFNSMIAGARSGQTLYLRAIHPANDQREIVVLLTSELLPGNVQEGKAASNATPAAASPKSLKKAREIILPKLHLQGASLEEALDYLRVKARELDPTREGLNIVLAEPLAQEAQISLQLQDVPLSEALKYVTELAGVGLKFDEHAVTVARRTDPEYKRTITPPPDSLPVSRAENIILPRVAFNGASLEEAVEFLRVKAKEHDPEKKGINILIGGPPPGNAQITLDLKDIPLSEALKYVAELAGMKLRNDTNASTLVLPETEKAGDLYTRAFRLPQGFFAEQANAKQRLETAGVTFPEGATATWVTASNQLIVRNTMAELEKVEAVVERAVNAAPQPAPRPAPVAAPAPAGPQGVGALVIPRVALNDAMVEEAIEFLRVKAKELDPAKQGVNIVIRAPKNLLGGMISLDLRDVPFETCLKYVTELGNLKLRKEPFAYIIE